MIQDYDVLQIGFYEYGQCFTGSDTGMRYRIAREPLENVHFTPMDKRGEAHLKVTICVVESTAFFERMVEYRKQY